MVAELDAERDVRPGIGLHRRELRLDGGAVGGERTHDQAAGGIAAAAVGGVVRRHRLVPLGVDVAGGRGGGEVVGILAVLGAARPGAGAGGALHIGLGQRHVDMVRKRHEAELHLAGARRGEIIDELGRGLAHGDVLDLGARDVAHRTRVVEHHGDLRLLHGGEAHFGGAVGLDVVDAGELHQRGRHFHLGGSDEGAVVDAEVAGEGVAGGSACAHVGGEGRLGDGGAFRIGLAARGGTRKGGAVERGLQVRLGGGVGGVVDAGARREDHRDGGQGKHDRGVATVAAGKAAEGLANVEHVFCSCSIPAQGPGV